MNASLLAIDNMFTSTTAYGPPYSDSASTGIAKPFSLSLAERPGTADAAETATTDNSTVHDAEAGPTSTPTQDFSHPLEKKAASQASLRAQDKTRPEPQPSNSETTATSNPAQLTPAQQPPIAGAVPGKGIAAGTEKPRQQQTAAEPSSDLAQLIDNPSLNKLTPFGPNATKGLNAANQENKGAQNADQTQMPGRKVVVTSSVVSQESRQKTSGSAGSARLVAKEVAADSHANSSNARSATSDSTMGAAGKKTFPLNYGSQPMQEASADTKQREAASPKKSTLIAEKPANSASFAKQTGNPPCAWRANSQTEEPSDNLTRNSVAQKLNVEELQISTGQGKGQGGSTSKNGSKADSEQIFAASNAGNSASQPLSTSMQGQNTATAPGRSSPSDAVGNIGEQIIESIHTSLRQADKQVTVRLHPPELGKVFLRLQEQQDHITGFLEVSKAETKYEIEQALPQIIRTLTDCGIQIKRLDVLLTDQPEQEAHKDQSLGDGAFEQYRSSEQGSSGNTSTSEAVADTYSHQDIREQQEMFVTDGRINMLI